MEIIASSFHGYVLHSSQIHTYSARLQDNFRSAYARTNTRYLNTKYIGSTVWNALLVHIQRLPTFAVI